MKDIFKYNKKEWMFEETEYIDGNYALLLHEDPNSKEEDYPHYITVNLEDLSMYIHPEVLKGKVNGMNKDKFSEEVFSLLSDLGVITMVGHCPSGYNIYPVVEFDVKDMSKRKYKKNQVEEFIERK